MFEDAVDVESGLITTILNAGIDVYLASKVISIVDSSVVIYTADKTNDIAKLTINITAAFLKRCRKFTLDALHKLQEALENVKALYSPNLDINVITSRLFSALGTFDFI